MDGIRVPVSLEVVLSSIANIKAAISNLKPDSKAWKELLGILRSMEREADRLLITMSKPFNTLTLFNLAEKSIEKMDEALSKASITMSRLNFSDIKLTPEQLATFNNLKQELVDILNSIKQFKTNAKAELLSDPIAWDSIVKVDPNAATRTFDELLKIIRKNNAKILEEYLKAQEIATAALNLNKLAEATEKAFSKANPLQEALGSDFSKFFELKKGSTTDYKFKTGQRNEFLQWVLDNFTLTDELIAEIKRTSGTKMAQLFLDIKAEAVAHALSIKTTNTEKQKHADELAALAANAARAANAMGELVDKVSAASAKYDLSILNNTAETERFMAAVTNTARSSDTFISADRLMLSQLENLRTTLATTNAEFLRMLRVQLSFNLMKMAIVNFMGFSLVLNLTKRAVREAINHIKELDSVMNKISIVTDMSTEDLWQQVDQYSKMAQNYGTTIKGAYEVSLIYYQQGLETNDVLTLTNETLKLAKVSGLDYAQTTDYMTTALRGFKMEMSEASTVVDVYSNLAAHTAVSLEELAVAMSKTASSMESVGSTFEESSAMIGTMVAVTRESATNIGSALKSIASRYGEMKSDPSILQDAEGEAIAYNKVDAALLSVGITLKTTDGQFRSFTDVILELSEVWDQLESTQQRYIATLFAGNRQQSRFLALVSNPELLKANITYAEESEDTGTLLALKALDSIESKLNQVLVAYQLFYTTMGVENVWKGLLDGATNVINTLNSFPKLFGKIPVGAIAAISSIVNVIKNAGIRAISGFANTFGDVLARGLGNATSLATTSATSLWDSFKNTLLGKKGEALAVGNELSKATANAMSGNKSTVTLTGADKALFDKNTSAISMLSQVKSGDDIAANAAAVALLNLGNISLKLFGELHNLGAEAAKRMVLALTEENNKLMENAAKLLLNSTATEQSTGKVKQWVASHEKWGSGLQSFGSALNMVAMMINTTDEGGKTLSGTLMTISGVATLAGVAIKATAAAAKGLEFSMPWMAIVTGLFAVINGISTLIITPEERLQELEEKAEKLNNEAKEAKANYRTLDNSIKKLDELKEKRYESAEAAEEYQTAVDDLAKKFPEMIAGFDKAGNIILDTTDAERILAEAREKSKEATYAAAKAEMNAAKDKKDLAESKLVNSVSQNYGGLIFNDTNLSTTRTDVANNIVKDIWNDTEKNGEYWGDSVYSYLKELYQQVDKAQYENVDYEFKYDWLLEDWDQIFDESSLYITEDKAKAYFDSLEEMTDTQRNIYNILFSNPLTLLADYNSLIDDIKNSIESKDYKSLKDLFKNAVLTLHALSEFGIDTTSLSETLSSIMSNYKNVLNLKDVYAGYSKEVISAWLLSSNANREAWEVLSSSSNAAAMITKLIANNIDTEYDGDYDKAIAEGAEENWKVYQENMYLFISSLSEDNLELFNAMTSDTSNYSALDIIDKFKINEKNPVYLYIIDYYSNGIKSILARLNASLALSLGKESLNNGTYVQLKTDDLKEQSEFYKKYFELISLEDEKNLTIIDEKYLNDILKQYDSLTKKGYASRASKFGEAALSLYTLILAAPEDIEKLLWLLINENGLTTLEGINQILNAIKNNQSLLGYIDKDTFNTLYNNIIPNINLEILTATSNLLDTWEDTSKELKGAMSSGVSLKEADALIQKAKSLNVDLSLDDFLLSGDKLILMADSFENYYKELNDSITKRATEWKERISKAKGFASTINNGLYFAYTESDRALLESIGFDLSKYYVGGKLTSEGIIELNKAILKNGEDLDNYNRAALIAADLLKNANDRSKGIYKLHTEDAIGLTKEQIEAYMDRTDLSWIGDDITIRAIMDEASQIYSTLMSDVFSKGWEKINLLDYEGLIDSDIANLLTFKDNKDYIGFAQEYGKIAGKTIDEINNLILLAYEKLEEPFSEDLIKDFTFTDKSTFKATRDSLTKLANAYDKNIEELINSSKLAFDETTQEYTIGVELLKDFGIDLSEIHNFEITVQESIDSLFSGLISDVQNALSGKLDIKGLANLKETLSALGIDVALDFVETSDGLQLTNDGLYDLYASIRKINQIGAKKLLPDMKLMSKSYGDLSSVMKEYKEAVSDASKANEALLLSDLIQDYLSNPDSFKFDLGYTNVLDEIAKNAYQGAFNTYKNWAEASKTNTIEADKFTSTLAQLAAYAPDKIIGTTGKTAQQLYDERFGYMTTDKNGNPIYDLESMGLTGKNITALMDAFEEYTNYIVEQSNIQLRAYMDLTYAQRELNKEGVLPKEGKLSLERIKELAGAGTALETVFKNIHFEDGTLYDRIFGENGAANVELANQFIRILSNTNLSLEEMQQQVSAMLGDEFVVSLDEKGQFKIDLANPILSVGGKELKGSAASEWQKAVSQAYEENINTDTGTITYTLDGQNVTLQVQEDGSVEYSLTLVGGDYAGAVITAGTEAELKRNLAAFGYLSSGTVDAVASKDSTITISGVTYTIKYDANGKIIVETPEGQENVDTEKVRTELLDKLRSEMEKESIPVDGKIEGEVSALELSLAEGASVELAAENVTLTKDVAKAEGNVTNLKLTYAGESTEQSIDTLGRIITGYVSEEYLDTKNEVKTIDLSYLGLGIVTLDTLGKKIKGVVDPANTEGTGTVPAGQCKLTINGTTVTIEDSAGNKYTGTLPDSVGENTTFSNTGFINAEKATLKISGGKITITTADGLTYTATIPLTILDTLNPTGSVSVDNCHVYSSGNLLYVEAPTGLTFVLGFKDGSLPGATGTVQASNCSIDVDSDTLTVSGTDADGNSKPYTVKFEEGTLKGSGELKSGACSVEIKEDGTWIITNKDGVSVPIPADKIKGSGDLTTAELIAKLAENSYTLNGVIPEFYLGEVSAFATFNNVELRADDPYALLREQLAGYEVHSKGVGKYGWEFADNALGHVFGDYEWHVDIDELRSYVTSLRELAKSGQILSSVDYHNLQGLMLYGTLPKDIRELAIAAATFSDSNTADLKTLIELLNGINIDNFNNLNELTTTVQNLTNALLLLLGIHWASIVEGLSSLTDSTSSEDVQSLSAKVELTPETQNFVDEVKKLVDTKRVAKISVNIGTDLLTNAIDSLISAIESTREINLKVNTDENGTSLTEGNFSKKYSKFTSTSKAYGNAFVEGHRQTLMGELGPELYVTNGHYYVAGQNGAEFVNLPKDAIVFNHLLTLRLLNGRNGVNGRPVTNERVAAGEAHALSSKVTLSISNTLTPSLYDAGATFALVFNAIKNSSIVTAVKDAFSTVTTKVVKKILALASINKYLADGKKLTTYYQQLMDKIAASLENTADNLEKITTSLTETAQAVEQASADLTNSTKSFNYDATRLHSGYRRAGGYEDDATSSASINNGRYKLKKRGPGDTSLAGWDSDRIRALATGNVGSGEDPKKKLQETLKLIGTVINNLLSQGLEAIDLSASDYDNLDKEIKAEMLAYINRADASYREFVTMYGEAANLTIKEFNEKYFEAWQRDAYLIGDSEEVLTAVEGLTFFRGGKVAGSAEDWTTIFGDFTDVAELVDAGLIEWDTQLRQYIITDIEALKQFDTNLDSIEDLVAMRNDDILENFKDILDKFSSALEGTLSNMDAISFKKQLALNGIDIDNLEFTKTAEGLKIAGQSAIKLYDTLSKIDGLLANVAFDALKENLEANDVHYRDMATINEHILNLTNEIAKLNATSDDTKLKQYQAELKVATEIRDMRIASLDDYYSQMGKSLEGGMNNPLDLIKDIVQINTALAKGNVGGNDLYNLLTRANNTAKIGGKAINLGNITLTGTEESLTEAWRKAISSGGLKLDENGESTFDLNALGIGLDDVKENTAQFIEGWNVEKEKAIEALNNNIPKAAIKEALTSIDIEGFGADDLIKDNAYTDTFKDAASKLIAKAAKDTRLLESLKGRTVGEHTLYDILTDAANGKEAVETAEDLSEALQEITNYLGDSTDLLERLKAVWENLPLDSITDLLEEMLEATTAFVGEIEKWFNYLQKIAAIEQDITYEEKFRSTVKNAYENKDGYAYFDSQVKSLESLNEQYSINRDLMGEYLKDFQEYAMQAREAGWNQVVHYDEQTGAVLYLNTDKLMEIFNVDKITGKPNTTQALEQELQLIEILGKNNYDALTKYTLSGELITSTGKSEQDAARERVQALFEKTNDLVGSLNTKQSDIDNLNIKQLDILDKESAIFNEIRNNQISLENSVLKAIVDTREREIKEQEKTRDALKNTFDNLINGLKDQLSRERKMAESQKDTEELTKLQRQLAILQRNGGSATQIASLQSLIADKLQDNYFKAQEMEIDKIEEAQNNLLEKLDALINIMKEELEYLKQFGLLWTQVNEIMKKSPEDIATFIHENDSQYWGKSATELESIAADTKLSAEQWAGYQKILNEENATLSKNLLDSESGLPKSFTELKNEYKSEMENLINTGIPKYGTNLDNIEQAIKDLKEEFNKEVEVTQEVLLAQELQQEQITDTLTGAVDTSTSSSDTSNDTPSEKENTQAQEEKKESKYTIGWNGDEKSGWWYADTEDHYLANQWLDDNGKWYYFDENGYMVSNTTLTIGDKKHGFDASGVWTGEIEENASTATTTPTLEYREYVSDGASGHHSVFHYSNGVTENGIITDHTFGADGTCTACGYKIPKTTTTFTSLANESIEHNASGGLVKRPTLSWLAERGEEAVLNAEQTKILKNDILGRNDTSLINLLQDFRAAYAGNSYSSINNGASVVIEHAEVNMKVDKLADSYDAAQAGLDVMREMLNIARKTSAQNRVGR